MPVHVELTDFCQDFTSALRPLSHSLDESIVALHDLPPDATLNVVLSHFVDIQHRLKILTDKAEQQHAYLLIFGPLKSGKSTLMNAISGAYVSEVSSLPAYPCLVYVHEGEPRKLSLTTFDGTREEFDSEEALHSRIEEAHAQLAEKLREADREGRAFNPAVDFPGAIRRIDYVTPAPNLRQSGTILVDTPGLYTKMRYNYEQLTRDFRHNAACAVFVVKTDNLFFDQVFDEFKDLLGVFSRVFLVVNIDSSKEDLAPRGRLRPSLESRDPRRIIQAFENFTASAQLREAIDNGQLKIYLVDLLETAQRSLAGEPMMGGPLPPADDAGTPESTTEGGAPTTEGETDAASEVGTQPDSTDDESVPEPEHGTVGFDGFLSDLTNYLNSSDYILEFMADSLRQGDTLITEIRDGLGEPSVERFRSETTLLEAELTALSERLNRVAALEKTDWQAAVQGVQAELDEKRQVFAESKMEVLRKRLKQRVQQWFETDESVAELVRSLRESEIAETDEALQSEVEALAKSRFQQRNSGLVLDAQTVGHLHKLEFSLDDFYSTYEGKRDGTNGHASNGGSNDAAAPGNLPSVDVRQDDMPVKKRWLDWILFRRPKSIRRSLFGSENPSGRKLAPALKEKRLSEPAGQHLEAQFDRFLGTDLRHRDRQALDLTIQSYGDYLQQTIRERLEKARRELEDKERDLRIRQRASQRVLEIFESLATVSTAVLETSDQLRQRFVGEAQAPQTEKTEESDAWDLEAELAPDDSPALDANHETLVDGAEAAALLDAETPPEDLLTQDDLAIDPEDLENEPPRPKHDS